ncbi:DNA repair protein [Croceibacterium mercuriale]|uniref:DNA polymerase IV n=2 Tax=Croceibacterium mercuriale TaxID=1572751 RepID=A0A0B2C3Y1_9SPHN|nr:DNA repair protein [Croceibacterium mercuriale]
MPAAGPVADTLRKIIHVDMDAFFASVEQRDDPTLRGKPVAVGGGSGRGVVAAASYEARVFGVRSAMPSATARRLCPDLIFCKTRFDVYHEVSQQIRAIFARFTDLIEPLSLDEAYLDVTRNHLGIASATTIAREIRRLIAEQTQLTASAGVSYNKFLAKLASDQNKPDGLCIIKPGEGAAFVAALPVRRFHGIGPRGAEKMTRLGVETGADLATKDVDWLRTNFGSFGDYLFNAARGIDHRSVRAHRERKSIGGERTFNTDLHAPDDLRDMLESIIDIVWTRIAEKSAKGRTITLKLKYNDFQLMTRARSLSVPVTGREQFTEVARALLAEQLPLPRPIRLMGLTLSALGEVPEPEPMERPRAEQLRLL